jgi:hypothetical protein
MGGREMTGLFGYYLPPGVTDSMCEPDDPSCTCGHSYSEHYDEDSGEIITCPNDRDHLGYDADGPMLNAQGETVSACDIKSCSCTLFEEGEYEPDYEDYRNDLD